MLDGITEDFKSYEKEINNMPDAPIEDECQGAAMLYSSGTTGKPKGVSREVNLSPLPYKAEEDDLGLTRVVQGLYSADEDSSLFVASSSLPLRTDGLQHRISCFRRN
jgi:hypothetical protein